MHKHGSTLIFSPSDLTRFLDSAFVTWMDRLELERSERDGMHSTNPQANAPRQKVLHDAMDLLEELKPDAETETEKILKQKGNKHEQEFVQQLKAEGRDVCDVSSGKDRLPATIAAMKAGKDVIYQAAFKHDRLKGYADFLMKVPGDSNLGKYHYEPWDTKLALRSKPYFLVQLACYAEMLEHVQGLLPTHVYVVLGNKQEDKFRTEDFFYYYQQVKQALINQQDNWNPDQPPDFIGLEEFRCWQTLAEHLMEQRDHLCRVAFINTVQIKKLYQSGVTTMTQLAKSKLASVPRMQSTTLENLKQQARLQIESKDLPVPKYELLPAQSEGQGLSALPAPSPLDVYFDMEGNTLAAGGLEYLFGATIVKNGKLDFIDWWAHDSQQEKRAFEDFIDWAYARWRKDPQMHIYHYASYEKTALRRLMGKYGTRERQVDDLLRNEVLVDLYTIVRKSLRVGTPNYSIKSIEHLYRPPRQGDVATALDSIVYYQRWLDQKDGDDWKTSKILNDIRLYNQEDCDSTWQLAEWLRKVQHQHKIKWQPPAAKEEPESEAAQERSKAAQLALKMLDELPAESSKPSDNLRLRELLAYLLEFHWREAKPVFWAKFDRHEMTEEELFEDPGCLAGLVRTRSAPREVARSFWYNYKFDPNQETKIDEGDNCFYAHDLNESIRVAEIDPDNGTIALKRAKNLDPPPDRLSLIKDEYVGAVPIAASIYRTAEAFMRGKQLPSAIEDFLCRRQPRVKNWKGGPLVKASTNLTAGAVDVITRLQGSTLCIQGPPGSGKTYTAAQAIAELLSRGKTVGITSNSHKAIANLMDKVAETVAARKGKLHAAKLQNNADDFHVRSEAVRKMAPTQFFNALPGTITLVGATAWVFSRPEADGLFDYLFVDEAGQVSVANLVGMSPSARNLVLIGDQMQLAQPLQGTHPGESGQSVLQYLLQDEQVIPDDFGIFLGTSWRMHPDVCRFISGAVYENSLVSQAGTEKRVLCLPASGKSATPVNLKASGTSATPLKLKESGILYVPVEHEGNSQDSEEEAAAIEQIVKTLQKCSFQDGKKVRPLTLDDILIVAPYNMQVRRLKALLPGAKVGSVDKFQGQEAPVVIVSMCSSTGDASPRGLEFIFSKNRLNVAISRAQTLAIVVGSPALARTHCSRVEQMELVNLFCRIMHEGALQQSG
jgi:predicted RecB family nuclease